MFNDFDEKLKDNDTEEKNETLKDVNKGGNAAKGKTEAEKTGTGKAEAGLSQDKEDILKIILDEKEDTEAPNGIVKLSKKVSFDDQVIEELDLRELKDISEKKARKIRELYDKITTRPSVSPETTEEYAIAAASYITGLPTAFFEHLPHKDIVKIRGRVINFFFSD